MNEKKATYDVTPQPGTIRPTCFLVFSDPGYTPPTPSEIRTIIQRLELSGREVADLVGVSDARNVRKWQAEGTDNKRTISYAAWRLLVLELYRKVSDTRTSNTLQCERVADKLVEAYSNA